MNDSTIKKIAFWAGVAGICIAMYGIGKARADTMTSNDQGSEFQLHCSGKNPEAIAHECMNEAWRRCPKGGKILVLAHSLPKERPIFVDVKVFCNEQPGA